MKATGQEMLSSQLCGTFFTLVRGTPEHFLLVLPGGLRSGVPSASCSTKLPHTALSCAMLRCTTSTLTPWHCIPAVLHRSPGHMWGSWHSPHAPNSLNSPRYLSHSCCCPSFCSRHIFRKPFSSERSTHQHFRAGSPQQAPSTGKS